MINAKNDSTTKGGTNIEAIFVRNIHKMKSKNLISYFSYHNPITSIVDEQQLLFDVRKICDVKKKS